MKIFLIIIVSLIVLLGIGYLVLSMGGPKKEDFEYLINPRINKKSNTRALVAKFDGDHNKVLTEAFGKIFKTYFSLKGVPKGKEQPAPMARYEGFEKNLKLSQEEIYDMPWKGFVALPIPDDVKVENSEGLEVREVEYGEVAEIVHFGPYEEETETINRLKKYIGNEGYEISGLHEEEYIKGPGFIYVSPKKYITIIRYQVKKSK